MLKLPLLVVAVLGVALSADLDDAHWEAVKLGQRYNVSTDNFPIRIKTVGASGSDAVWLKVYFGEEQSWGRRWGMVRWRFSDYGMELYSCTEGSYSGSKFTNVPDDDEKVWELSWDDKEYTIKCNDVTVWQLSFEDGKYSSCAKYYSGRYGALTQFEFKADDQYAGLDTASDYYYNAGYDGGCPTGTIQCPDGECRQGCDHWEPVQRGKKYDVTPDTFPIKIKTVGASGDDAVWLKYYFGPEKSWGRRWGNVRWRFSDYGMGLHTCTEGSYFVKDEYYTGGKFTNVPDDDVKVWEIDWDSKEYTIKCNGVTVWQLTLADGKSRRCAKYYSGGYGDLQQFEFKADDKYWGFDTASDYFYNEAYNS